MNKKPISALTVGGVVIYRCCFVSYTLSCYLSFEYESWNNDKPFFPKSQEMYYIKNDLNVTPLEFYPKGCELVKEKRDVGIHVESGSSTVNHKKGMS